MESFYASLRSGLLDHELFFDVREVRAMAEDWGGYNHRRPHGFLNYVLPVRHQQQASLRFSPEQCMLLEKPNDHP